MGRLWFQLSIRSSIFFSCHFFVFCVNLTEICLFAIPNRAISLGERVKLCHVLKILTRAIQSNFEVRYKAWKISEE